MKSACHTKTNVVQLFMWGSWRSPHHGGRRTGWGLEKRDWELVFNRQCFRFTSWKVLWTDGGEALVPMHCTLQNGETVNLHVLP